MLGSENEVQVTSDTGHKNQWAKGLFYRKDGQKLTFKNELINPILFLMFTITGVVILFKEDPRLYGSNQSLISLPQNLNVVVVPMDLEIHDETKQSPRVISKNRSLRVERLSLVSRKESLKIPLGAQAKAKLLTGGTNGTIKAQLIEDLKFNGEVYLTAGTFLWGQGSSTEARLMITFSKAVSIQGQSYEVQAQAYDGVDDILGLKGSVIGRTSKKILAGAGLGVAGALQTLQSSQNIGGIAVKAPSLENALMNGASTAALGIAEQELEDLQNNQVVIEVKKGTEILVVFGKG